MTHPLTRETRWPRPLALACILCVGGALQAQTPGAYWLENPDASATGVSADGSVVIGMGGPGGAFAWTQAWGTTALPGVMAEALAVSGDGSVVVGMYEGYACLWKGGVRTELAYLPGEMASYARAINADGTVVVGDAMTGMGMIKGMVKNMGKGGVHAFRWTQGEGKVDIHPATDTAGFLGADHGGESFGYGVSGDGAVVVGQANLSDAPFSHAFRWTQGTGMVDLGSLGGFASCAYGISSNGAVVVGRADIAGPFSHAFRWTQVGGMKDLGTLAGGNVSSASAANADGSVIVGWSEDAAYNPGENTDLVGATGAFKVPMLADHRAFRWTQVGGMQTVEDWVIANGGKPLAAGNMLYEANGVSADGNVVVGSGYLNGTKQPFVARGSGVLGFADFHGSLTQPTVAGTTLHERMRSGVMTDLQNNAPRQGQFAFSSMAVYEKYTKSEAEGHGTAGTVKLIYGFTDAFRAGFSYIRGGESIDLGGNGSLTNHVDIFGGLVSYGEYTGEGLRGRLSFAYGGGHSDITRDYLTGSGSDQSTGRMSVHQEGATLEGGYGFRLSPRTLLTPSLSCEWVQTHLGGYTEHGGSFPASFDARNLVDSYARVGLKLLREFGTASNVTLEGNYVSRLSSVRNPVSGNLVGLYGFSSNVDLSHDWTELRVGIEHVPVSISKNLHLLLRYQASLGQSYDVPAHRVEAGFSYYF